MIQGSRTRWGFPDFPDFEQGLYFFAPYDGNEPFENNYTGSVASIKGQTNTVIPSGLIFRPGLSNRYGERTKAVQVAGTRTNLFENPSFETNMTYISVSGAGVSIARTITTSVYGQYSLRVDCDGSVSNQGINLKGSGTYSAIPVSPSTSYAFSVYFKRDTPANTRFGITWRDSSGGYPGTAQVILPGS